MSLHSRGRVFGLSVSLFVCLSVCQFICHFLALASYHCIFIQSTIIFTSQQSTRAVTVMDAPHGVSMTVMTLAWFFVGAGLALQHNQIREGGGQRRWLPL